MQNVQIRWNVSLDAIHWTWNTYINQFLKIKILHNLTQF
jgi:hypothetical protein